jgi:Transposase DNA-binding
MNIQELLNPKSWAERTFGGVQLHDRRRTKRAVQAARKLAENPLGSLPAHMQTWKETKALYRRLPEPDVTFAALMQPHLHQTRDQANSSPAVLLVQETTDIDLSHRHKISGVGQIGNERGRGFFVQTVLAVRTQTREVLGCMAQEPGCRAFPLLRENSGINGASGKRAKLMSGYARYKPLGRLSREACGCMSATLVRICSPSFKHVRRRRRTFWCERESHGVCRRAKTRSAIR